MMSKILSISIILSLLVCHQTQAESTRFESGKGQKILLELYTSQGCSSCPPAERWLGGLKESPKLWKEVVPVAFHVDYWDYIGWRDVYAKSEFSTRQRNYRQQGSIGSVYTPGFVLNGNEWRGWFTGSKLPDTREQPGNLIIELTGRELDARFESNDFKGRSTILNIVVLGTDLNVEVARGENAGRRLPQDFVALHYMRLEGEGNEWTLQLPVIDEAPGVRYAIAAWVNEKGKMKPIQAAGGWM